MFFFSNGYLKERIEYRERLVKLKWDAWFYVTGVDMIINLTAIIFIILGVILFIFANQNSYVDPFADVKTMYNIMNGIFIVGLIGLNCYFIFKGAESDECAKKMTALLIVSTICLIISLSVFFQINNMIDANMSQFYESNPNVYGEEGTFASFFTFDKFAFKTPFLIIGSIELLILICMIYHNATWLYRLTSKKETIDKTDILFDEEKNIKF